MKIPRANTPKKRAVPAENIKKLLSIVPTTKRSELAQDVAKLMVYLVGIYTVDLYHLKNTNFKKVSYATIGRKPRIADQMKHI